MTTSRVRMKKFAAGVCLAALAIIAGLALAGGDASAGEDPPYVTKTADVRHLPPEGGVVTFTIGTDYIDQSPIDTVTSLVDSDFGDLTNPSNGATSTCVLPQTIPYQCTVTATLTPDGFSAHENTVTAAFGDGEAPNLSEDTDSARVEFIGIAATKTASPATLPTAGGEVTYTFGVSNRGSVAMQLESLVDDKLGDLHTQGTCDLPKMLGVGDAYSCTVTTTLPAGTPGVPYVNTVTATASEAMLYQNGNALAPQPVTVSATATASVDYIATGITATKTASPTSVPETGGDVTFTFTVTNVGGLAMTIDTMDDDKLGSLAGKGNCAVGQVIPPQGSYTCAVTTRLVGSALTPHVNTVTVSATSEDTAPPPSGDSFAFANARAGAQAAASATVTFQRPGGGDLGPAAPEPAAAPTAAPAPAPVAPAAASTDVVPLAVTASESRIPASLGLAALGLGTLALGVARRRRP